MDAHGTIVGEQVVQHTGESIREFLRSLEVTERKPDQVAVGIEVPRGPVVEAFLERGYAVYSINPKQLDRFRDRHSVAGAKDDRRDAFVLASSNIQACLAGERRQARMSNPAPVSGGEKQCQNRRDKAAPVVPE
jgi:hypothetical protein